MEENNNTPATPAIPAEYYLGSDFKALVQMTAPGFDMDLDDWSVSVMIDDRKTHTYKKADCVRANDGKYYVPVSRDYLKKTGTLKLVGNAEIPDTDFPDGIRHESVPITIGKYKKL